MSIDKIIRENIDKLVNESMNTNANDVIDEIFSNMDYQIHIETINLNKKSRYYEEIKRLVNIYKEDIQNLGLQYSHIEVINDDDNTEIDYHIQGSEQWTEDDFWNMQSRMPKATNDDMPYYYIDETYNLNNNKMDGYKIVLSIPVGVE